ncbi:MAG: LPS export ABC transporter periplasmic protein LptC [Bacteroidetes bacterium]|nr:LPS export ABC transporter periplasmic protein LptC [Bacteroidota bacterium]
MKVVKLYLFLLLLIYACTDNISKNTMPEQDYSDQPDQVCYNMDFVFFDSSYTKTIIHSKRTRVYNKKNETVLDSGVFVRFFNNIGVQTGILQADIVVIDDITKDMLANTNVVVISDSSNTKLETNELKWRHNDRKIYTDAKVKITSPNEVIEGIGLISNEDLSNYKIYKVTGIRQ